MLLPSWFLAGILILVKSALCSDVQDDKNLNGKIPEQLQVDTENYRYNHPPPSETTQNKGIRKEKSVNINEQISLTSNRSSLRGHRRRTDPIATSKPDTEIPVKVIYDTESTTPRVHTRHTTISPVTKTTRVFVQRRPIKSTTTSGKKIDIRQTTIRELEEPKITEEIKGFTDSESNVSSSTEFPKRSRGSYFKKRTGPPAPRVKILEEQNFVYSHSGNFHYSYLGGDGTKISSQGELKSFDNDKTGEAVSGSVYYKDKDGNDFNLSYTADENGYRPVGAHLPTPPPLPPAIARALKYIADKSTPAPITPSDKNE